mmetsp:Transcript_14427/g.27725  ORF Transcript_14427/g.27725 Transcript_14427/m.27725 type:complete len:186 (+) Transcript_14427:115-672(+)|eukprot:CAMPEP_0114252842 /NCGR_PEP_ID=MMETSP0058-20121206/16065_1 /TAXON_ID=36894 /ORGANISM="Pyramimonas parkeae, CCMP726" /LENGTH=185 /DNA_ID=CAMNT_0001366829 /DNA_START=114 /DNA_END=671 /DNA_ORIENTATION=+
MQSRTIAQSVSGTSANINIRRGRTSDAGTVRRMVLKEKMNPLGLDVSRFLVAEDSVSGKVKGFGQLVEWPCLYHQPDWRGVAVRALNLKPNWEGDLVEVRSVVVDPASRGQGVGSAIVKALVQQASDKNVCLLTIEPTVSFYEKLGFKVVSPEDVPRPIKPEQFWGSIAANLAVGASVVVMAQRT